MAVNEVAKHKDDDSEEESEEEESSGDESYDYGFAGAWERSKYASLLRQRRPCRWGSRRVVLNPSEGPKGAGDDTRAFGI